MAKTKKKKKLAVRASKVSDTDKPNVMSVTEVPSLETRIGALEQRLDRIVYALTRAKKITKDM